MSKCENLIIIIIIIIISTVIIVIITIMPLNDNRGVNGTDGLQGSRVIEATRRGGQQG